MHVIFGLLEGSKCVNTHESLRKITNALTVIGLFRM